MKFAYYPGCSLRGTGRAYEESLLAVFRALDIQLEELEDWNCCGATTYMSFDEVTSYALSARNLAIAERMKLDIAAPCAACYLCLNKTQHVMRDYPHINEVVQGALKTIGLNYQDRVKVRHPLDILWNDMGVEAIRKKVKVPLKGVKVAPYYGCQIVRPYAIFDDQNAPVSMDRLLEAAGAEVIDYPVKTRCCGASQKGTLPEMGLGLLARLLTVAKERGADVIATACPLCQFNLELFQDEANGSAPPVTMPVVFFTQLLGLALGAPAKDIGFKHSVVPIQPMLRQKEIACV
jgi:heterodisulfide reductase subunit B2